MQKRFLHFAWLNTIFTSKSVQPNLCGIAPVFKYNFNRVNGGNSIMKQYEFRRSILLHKSSVSGVCWAGNERKEKPASRKESKQAESMTC